VYIFLDVKPGACIHTIKVRSQQQKKKEKQSKYNGARLHQHTTAVGMTIKDNRDNSQRRCPRIEE